MTILFLLLGLVLFILLIGKINLTLQFHKQVKELFAQTTDSNQIFHKTQLNNLPEPVQRYFKHVLNEEQRYINYVRIKHDGKFKTDLKKDWINIKGEQYATTQKPGFIWKGTTKMFVARDMYISNKGRLIVSLLSLYNVVDAKGETYNEGELLRWLGESVMYPTNLLPNENLCWETIDSNTAKLIFNHMGMSLYFIITFNDVGEITQMETKRYMDETNRATWIIKTNDYKEFNSVLIPTYFDVMWRLEKGDFSYAQFHITEVEYNIPEKF